MPWIAVSLELTKRVVTQFALTFISMQLREVQGWYGAERTMMNQLEDYRVDLMRVEGSRNST
jgi:hypothetical protein